jgi:2-hydroxy-4-carboxymuconate semialdehyde hemiacetal dehydrogenase
VVIGVALVGAGAFGLKHLRGLAGMDDVRVVCVVDASLEIARRAAEGQAAAHATAELSEALGRGDVDGVILCTPTPIHAAQAIACLEAGKHVQVEIPLADTLRDAEAVLAAQGRSGRIAMVGHTRRFNPSHQWIRQRIAAGALSIQQLEVQTHFFRRRNLNALGEPRTWTDNLLWHHAAHTIDLFAYQAGDIVTAHALRGPIHPVLGVAMDMAIHLRSASGAICTLSLSFNNDGPFGSVFRYICDNGTYVARYDDLADGHGVPVDLTGAAVSADGVVAQDRAFIDAIREGREPNASVAQVMPCYRVMDALERQLAKDGV